MIGESQICDENHLQSSKQVSDAEELGRDELYDDGYWEIHDSPNIKPKIL